MDESFKKEDLISDSVKILELLKSNDIANAKKEFDLYEEKWSEHQFLVPFIHSVREYLYDSFAREKGVTSLKIIEDNFESDILNKN